MSQRIPMRKPMPMVQYWVNTGKLPCTKNANDTIFSDSGIFKGNCSESADHLPASYPIKNCDSKTFSGMAVVFNDECTKLLSSSSDSTNNTVHYIFANHTRRQADTVVPVADLVHVKRKSRIYRSFQSISTIQNNVIEDHKKETRKLKSNYHNESNVNALDITSKDVETALKKIINKQCMKPENKSLKLIHHNENTLDKKYENKSKKRSSNQKISNLSTQSKRKRLRLHDDTEYIEKTLSPAEKSLLHFEHPAFMPTPEWYLKSSEHRKSKYRKSNQRRKEGKPQKRQKHTYKDKCCPDITVPTNFRNTSDPRDHKNLKYKLVLSSSEDSND